MDQVYKGDDLYIIFEKFTYIKKKLILKKGTLIFLRSFNKIDLLYI